MIIMKKKSTEQLSKEKIREEKRKLLYTYWNELQFTKIVDYASYDLLVRSEVKNFIIKYLRDGLVDDFGKEHNLSQRHAFSAKELHDAFSRQPKTKHYSPANFHFHIKSLLNDGFVKEVSKILEGRQYISYYGRTAITFTFNYDNHIGDIMQKAIFSPMKLLIKELNPEMESDQIEELMNSNLKNIKDYFFRVRLWMKEYYTQLYNSKLDLHIFFEMIGIYSFLHKDLFEDMSKISSLIKLDQLMKYDAEEVENEQNRSSD